MSSVKTVVLCDIIVAEFADNDNVSYNIMDLDIIKYNGGKPTKNVTIDILATSLLANTVNIVVTKVVGMTFTM